MTHCTECGEEVMEPWITETDSDDVWCSLDCALNLPKGTLNERQTNKPD